MGDMLNPLDSSTATSEKSQISNKENIKVVKTNSGSNKLKNDRFTVEKSINSESNTEGLKELESDEEEKPCGID